MQIDLLQWPCKVGQILDGLRALEQAQRKGCLLPSPLSRGAVEVNIGVGTVANIYRQESGWSRQQMVFSWRS